MHDYAYAHNLQMLMQAKHWSVTVGIQVDIKACVALGAYYSSVITVVTAQNTVGVQACKHQ
jgi:hydroxymethylpyrimidine/phosphomethylpyrimidine kinase